MSQAQPSEPSIVQPSVKPDVNMSPEPSMVEPSVKHDESSKKADALNETVFSLLAKVTYVERRLMYDDIKPHAVIRMFMEAMAEFKPNLDPSWALRRMRDVSLAYWRVLRSTYFSMNSDDCGRLVRLLLYEA